MANLIHENKIRIEKGEDKTFEVLLWNKELKRNFDLTSYDYFEFHFKTDDNSTLVKTSTEVAAIAATGTTEGTVVDLIADNPGAAGNSISLVFDGSDDVDTVLLAWNSANPLNTASIANGDGTTVPSASTLNLSGGVDAITYVTKETPNELGILYCTLNNTDTNSLMKGDGMAIRIIMDSGNHPTGKRISKTLYQLDVLPSAL